MAQVFLVNAVFLRRGEWGGTRSSMVTASTTCIFGRLRMSSKLDDFRIFGCVHVAFKIPRKNSQLAGIQEIALMLQHYHFVLMRVKVMALIWLVKSGRKDDRPIMIIVHVISKAGTRVLNKSIFTGVTFKCVAPSLL